MPSTSTEVIFLSSGSDDSDDASKDTPPLKRPRKCPARGGGALVRLRSDVELEQWAIDDEGSWVTYLPSIVDKPAAVLEELIRDVPWGQGKVKIFGKEHLERRLTAFYADDGKQYRYSGGPLRSPLPFDKGPTVIKDMRERVAKVCGQQFNCCLLNYYRDGSDNIGMHSDDEKLFGRNPSIACISLGADRDFFLDSKKGRDKVRISPRNGSLLVMGGRTQELWKHGLPTRKKEHRPRVSLTFRLALWGDN